MNEAHKKFIETIIGKLEEIKSEKAFDSAEEYVSYLESLKEKYEDILEELEDDISNLETAIDYLELVEDEDDKENYLDCAIDSLSDIIY